MHFSMEAIDRTQEYVVVTFGCNDDGQLGRETDASESNPVLLPTANSPPKKQKKTPTDSVLLPLPILTFPTSGHLKITITAISCGSRHTLALDRNNAIVFSWGWVRYQLFLFSNSKLGHVLNMFTQYRARWVNWVMVSPRVSRFLRSSRHWKIRTYRTFLRADVIQVLSPQRATCICGEKPIGVNWGLHVPHHTS